MQYWQILALIEKKHKKTVGLKRNLKLENSDHHYHALCTYLTSIYGIASEEQQVPW